MNPAASTTGVCNLLLNLSSVLWSHVRHRDYTHQNTTLHPSQQQTAFSWCPAQRKKLTEARTDSESGNQTLFQMSTQILTEYWFHPITICVVGILDSFHRCYLLASIMADWCRSRSFLKVSIKSADKEINFFMFRNRVLDDRFCLRQDSEISTEPKQEEDYSLILVPQTSVFHGPTFVHKRRWFQWWMEGNWYTGKKTLRGAL